MLLQLRDCSLAVADKEKKTKLQLLKCLAQRFAADCLLKWFNKKFKLNNLELSNDVQRKYEI